MANGNGRTDPPTGSTSRGSAGGSAAEDRAAKIRAAGRPAARAERMRRVTVVGTAIVLALVVIAVVAVIRLTGSTAAADPKPAAGASLASAATVKGVSTVPSSVVNAVGAGTSANPPKKIQAPKLTSGGKPRFLYVGAEYCPYCAAQRWGVAVALSRFGTWSNLGTTTSSPSDVAPNTATLSFHGATFTSKYLSFTGIEETTNQLNSAGNGYTPLDTLSSADQAIVTKYDNPPYVEKASAGAIPFIDIGGTWISAGASFQPTDLAGLSQDQIAAKLDNADDKITREIVGEANHLTAAICDTTGGKPAGVCVAPGVLQASDQMGGNPAGSSSSSSK